MASNAITQKTFTTGEVDVTTYKRTDIEDYLTAAQSLLNCEVGTTGLAKKRKGSILLDDVTAYAGFNSRMYEFVDNNGDYYVVLSAAGHFYIFGSPEGQANVINYEEKFVVTGSGSYVVAHTVGLQFVQDVVVPYTLSDLDDIDYTQDNDNLIISHGDYPTGRIYISAYNPTGFPTFAFEYLNIYPYPAYDFNEINYNATTVTLSVVGSVLTISFANLPAGATYTSAWIGGQIIGGGTSDIEPIGYAIITNVNQVGTTVTFTATVQIAFQTVGYATSGSQYSIRQPAWSAALGYPKKSLYYQNRLWLANSAALPGTIAGSKINQPINFDVGTGKDTDAIIYTIGQTNSGGINWLNGGKQMEIYCRNLEFACPQDQNVGLTPSTFSIRQQTSFGSSTALKPITYINDSYFSSRTGKAIINYHFEGVGLTYSSSNISAASSHLVKNPSNRAILRGDDDSQDNFIYFLNPSDDTLTAFQFAAEYKLAALTPVTFQDNVELIDICTIDNTIYILKYYRLSEKFTIEAFDATAKIDCQFDSDMQTSGLVTGLELLEGYNVQVVFENQDFGQYTVTGGQITVDNPDGYDGTVQIGLLYDVDLTPMYYFGGQLTSPFFKNVNRIYVDYYNSLNFYINGKLVPYQTFANIQAGLPLVPQTGTAIIDVVDGYNRFSTFSITQSSPFDLQILGIEYQIDTAVI